MNTDIQILSDCLKGILQVLSDLDPFIDWQAAGPELEDYYHMAVSECAEAVGLADPCEGGACQW